MHVVSVEEAPTIMVVAYGVGFSGLCVTKARSSKCKCSNEWQLHIFTFNINNLKLLQLFTFAHTHLAAVVEGAHVARVHFGIVGATI